MKGLLMQNVIFLLVETEGRYIFFNCIVLANQLLWQATISCDNS
uniref:Uncharacterized protein n=1 Tax=Arundo donax TaxID=35708 RepID=A0A0A8YND4_ARUDO